MAAFLTALSAIWALIWKFVSPVKWYILTAILSIVLWQASGVGDWFHPVNKPWDTKATVVSVDSATDITVNHVDSNVLNRKRHVIVQGVLTDPNTLSKVLPVGTEVTIHVTNGAKLGGGTLTGIVDTGAK